MKIALLPRHFSGTIGRAHRVDLDHPHVADRLVPGAPVRLWVAGVEVSKPTPSRNAVVDEGEGRCIVDGTKLWISIPGNPDPRAANFDLVVDVPLTTDRETFPAARPLLILGPQRCGSTALQWALDNCTAHKAPRDLRGFLDNTLEGFYLTQLLKSLLNHPHWSPLGRDATSHFWGTGLLQDCGFSVEMLAGLARHIDAAYSNSSGTQGTWTDKCPGWDSVIIAPLFRALFPRGRVFFISREPVSNVLSIMRLRGELGGESGGAMSEERRLAAAAQASAVWTVAHYLWRRYVRPIMPPGSITEIDFAKFRRRDAAVLAAVGDAAGLSEAERAAVQADLGAARVPSHSIEREALEPWLVPVIGRLCAAEAQAWGYAAPRAVDAGDGTSPQWNAARSAFLSTVFHSLAWLGLSTDAVNAAAMHFVPEWKPTPPPQAAESPGAGSLLTIMLASQGIDRNGHDQCC